MPNPRTEVEPLVLDRLGADWDPHEHALSLWIDNLEGARIFEPELRALLAWLKNNRLGST